MDVIFIANFNNNNHFLSLFLRPLDHRYQIQFHIIKFLCRYAIDVGISYVSSSSLRISWHQSCGIMSIIFSLETWLLPRRSVSWQLLYVMRNTRPVSARRCVVSQAVWDGCCTVWGCSLLDTTNLSLTQTSSCAQPSLSASAPQDLQAQKLPSGGTQDCKSIVYPERRE